MNRQTYTKPTADHLPKPNYSARQPLDISNNIATLLSITMLSIITLALLPANWAGLGGLLLLWSVAGIGQTLVNAPTQPLIADRVDVDGPSISSKLSALKVADK